MLVTAFVVTAVSKSVVDLEGCFSCYANQPSLFINNQLSIHE